MKKTVCFILAVLILTGCSTVTEKESDSKMGQNVSEKIYTASTYITEDMKKKAGDASSITAETINKTIGEWSEDADLVVLATVILSLIHIEMCIRGSTRRGSAKRHHHGGSD